MFVVCSRAWFWVRLAWNHSRPHGLVPIYSSGAPSSSAAASVNRTFQIGELDAAVRPDSDRVGTAVSMVKRKSERVAVARSDGVHRTSPDSSGSLNGL